MDTVYGKMINKYTKECTEWIKKKDLGYINGQINKSTKVNLNLIIDKDMENFIIYQKMKALY